MIWAHASSEVILLGLLPVMTVRLFLGVAQILGMVHNHITHVLLVPGMLWIVRLVVKPINLHEVDLIGMGTQNTTV